jgi:hypothetical protein
MPVDWSAPQDVADRSTTGTTPLGALRVIAAIADFHRRHNPDDSAASLGDVFAIANAPAPADPRVPPDLSAGEPWGPLIVLERIDGGSFGDVFRAWDPTLAKVVALKRSRYSSPADAARAVMEAQRLANIPPHPNVITVYGACNVNGVVGIWMEFLRGRTLQRLVKDEGQLGWVEATYYGECLCRALSHVHGALVLHRDLKPANVMKAAGGRVVLIDFGSGGEIAPLGAPGPDRLVGTLPYMAPELFAGKPATQQGDIYSLGVVLFNLVTGSYPVSGNSRQDFEDAHRAGRRALLSDVRSDLPMHFVRVVERAIAPNLEHRYRTAGEFLHDLVPSTPSPDLMPSHDPTAWTTNVLWAALGIVCGVTGIGLVTSRVFNVALGRSDFADESLGDVFQWGWMSCVKPAFIALVAFVAAQLLTIVHRLASAVSGREARFVEGIRRRLAGVARRLGVHDSSVFAGWILFASVAVLAGAWWHFSPLLAAVVSTRISTASNQDLALLSPANYAYHDHYREVSTYITVALAVTWYFVGKRILRTDGTLKNGVLLSGLAVLCLSLISLSLPYRLLVHPDFVRTRWAGNDCYVIGERSDDLLLFCPTLASPRNRIIRKDAETLERFGAENIFTKFSGQQQN